MIHINESTFGKGIEKILRRLDTLAQGGGDELFEGKEEAEEEEDSEENEDSEDEEANEFELE